MFQMVMSWVTKCLQMYVSNGNELGDKMFENVCFKEEKGICKLCDWQLSGCQNVLRMYVLKNEYEKVRYLIMG